MDKTAIAVAALAILAVVRSILLKQRARNALQRKLASESCDEVTVRSCSVFAGHDSVGTAFVASLSAVYLEALKGDDSKGVIRNTYKVSCNPITGKVRDIVMLHSKT